MIRAKLFLQRNYKTLFLSILLSLIISLLIYNKIIYPAITPMVKNGILFLFADWTVIVNANLCLEKGFDVFIQNPCDPWSRKHVYGEILLYLPFVDVLKKFYLFYFPIIMNFLFIYVFISFFNYKKSLKNYTFFFFVLSAPFLIAVERANNDILIFLIIFLVSKYRNLIISHILILFGALSKFYPVCFGIIFLFKKDIKKILINLALLSLFISIFIFFQLESLIKIFNIQTQFSAGNVYAFSFTSLINTIGYFQLVDDLRWLKIFFIIVFLLIPFLLIVYLFAFKKNRFFSEIFTNNIFENRIYIISSITLISCYFIIKNIFYREIFFLGLIPWLLKYEDQESNIKDFYYYFILFKFFATTIIIYLVVGQNNFLLDFKPLLILLKHTIDFYLMAVILSISTISLYNFFKKDLIFR